MGLLGSILFLGCMGITIYFLPVLIYNITFSELTEILNAESLNKVETLLKDIGLIEETAKQQATQMLLVCLSIAFVLFICCVACLIKSYKRNK